MVIRAIVIKTPLQIPNLNNREKSKGTVVVVVKWRQLANLLLALRAGKINQRDNTGLLGASHRGGSVVARLSGQRVWLAIQRSRVRVPLWPLPGFVSRKPRVQIHSHTCKIANWFSCGYLGFWIMLWIICFSCLLGPTSMLVKQDQNVEKWYIYVEFPYLCPNYNISIQIVIYISKL